MNADLIRSVKGEKDQRHNKKNKKDDGEEPKNKGKLQADTTVADQDIAYPTDNGILKESRKKCEKMIDVLYELDGKQGVKPRTYRRTMNRAYLDYSKKKTKSKGTHRKMPRKLLECVKRNIKHLDHMLDEFENRGDHFPLTYAQQRLFWIIRTSYDQQKYMYDTDTHSCPARSPRKTQISGGVRCQARCKSGRWLCPDRHLELGCLP